MAKISLNHIAKIEGHARLDLHITKGKLTKCELGSIEGSRYFEGLLKGRDYTDAPEITSRICGICSSAHGVASVMAMEHALGIKPTNQTVILRELQTIGERIRSHAAHLYLLALPDYLGYESALAMKDKYAKEIARALRLVKLGNEMVTLISGRVMHQVSNWIGGFTHFPSHEQLASVKDALTKAKKDIEETAELIVGLPYPDFERPDTRYFSLSRKDAYATSHGFVKVGKYIFEQDQYKKMIEEYHKPYSNANFVVKEGKGYYVGALARINNNYEHLSSEAKVFMKKHKIKTPMTNPFHNLIAQAIELIHYREECIRVLENFEVRPETPRKPKKKAGHGIAMNEAPRGNVIHEYKTDNHGKITYANVVTPTAQFLRNMQDDVKAFTEQLLKDKATEAEIKRGVEMLIRSYDPCFSCATHFVHIVNE
jgi:sulfhydrogenase subunit alpha